MENIVWFDLITLSLILILGLKGVINGFIKEVFGLVGIVGGIYIASRFAEDAGVFIDANIYAFENKASLFLIGFIGILLAFWLLSLIFGQIIGKLLSMSGLSGLDKIMGFFIGSAKIFLVFSIFLVTLSNIEFVQSKIESYMSDSFMYPVFMEVGQKILELDAGEFSSEIPSAQEVTPPQEDAPTQEATPPQE
jgi:membrane protein required for colicin V production